MPKEYENKLEAESAKEYFDVLTLRASDAISAIQNDKTPEVKSINYLVESSLKRLKELKNLFYTESPSDASLRYLISGIHQNKILLTQVNQWIELMEKAIIPALKRRLQYFATFSLNKEDNLLLTDVEDDHVVVSHSYSLNDADLYSCEKILELLEDGEEKQDLYRQFNLFRRKNDTKPEYSQSALSTYSDSMLSSDSELAEMTESDDDSDNEEAKSELYPLKFTLKKTSKPFETKDNPEAGIQGIDKEIKPQQNKPIPTPVLADKMTHKQPGFTRGEKVLIGTTMTASLGAFGGVIGLLLASTLGPFAIIVGGAVGLLLGLGWSLKKLCISTKITQNTTPNNVADVKSSPTHASTTHVFNQPGFKNTVEKKLHGDIKKTPRSFSQAKPITYSVDTPEPLSRESRRGGMNR